MRSSLRSAPPHRLPSTSSLNTDEQALRLHSALCPSGRAHQLAERAPQASPYRQPAPRGMALLDRSHKSSQSARTQRAGVAPPSTTTNTLGDAAQKITSVAGERHARLQGAPRGAQSTRLAPPAAAPRRAARPPSAAATAPRPRAPSRRPCAAGSRALLRSRPSACSGAPSAEGCGARTND